MAPGGAAEGACCALGRAARAVHAHYQAGQLCMGALPSCPRRWHFSVSSCTAPFHPPGLHLRLDGGGAGPHFVAHSPELVLCPLPQGFIPGWMVEALDHETLRRMIKAYMALPFSGV